MLVCFLEHTRAALHSFNIGPLSFGATYLVFYMRVYDDEAALYSVAQLNLFTGFPMSSGHCSSPFAILSHFRNRS